MPRKVVEIQDQLIDEIVIGVAGDGLIEVAADGTGEVKAERITLEAFAPKDPAFIQDLLPQAVNDAISKGKQLHKQKLKKLSGGRSLPGMDKMMDQILGC